LRAFLLSLLSQIIYISSLFFLEKKSHQKKIALTPKRRRYACALLHATLLLVWCDGMIILK